MAFSLGELSALVTLDKSEFDSGMKQLPSTAENSFRKIAQLAASYLSFRSLMGSVNAFFVQQDAVEGLRSSLRNLGQQTRETMADYQKFASEIQGRTRYGDEEVLQAMSQGLRLGIDPKRIREVTEAAVGLSAKIGGDLSHSMSLLARASQGHTEMLARMGLQFDTTKDKAEQFNDIIGMSRDGLSLAEDAAKTAKGAYDQMKNSVSDASEKIGEVVAGQLRPIWEGMKNLAVAYQEASDRTQRLTGETALLGAGLVALSTVGVSITGPIGLVLAGAAGLAVALNEVGAEERNLHLERQRRFAEEYADARALETSNIQLAESERQKMARLQELASYQALTSREQEEAKKIVEELTEKYHGLGIAFDEASGKLTMQTSSMRMIERLKELAEKQNLSNREQAEADRIARQLNERYAGLNIIVDRTANGVEVLANAWGDLTRLQELARNGQSLSNAEQETAKALIEELTRRYGDLGVSFDAITGKIVTQTDAWAKLTEEQRKNAIEDAKRSAQATKREFNNALLGLPQNVSKILSPFDYNNLKDDSERIRNAYLKSPEEGLRVARGIRDIYSEKKGLTQFDNLVPYIEDVISKLEKVVEEDKRIEQMKAESAKAEEKSPYEQAAAAKEAADKAGKDARQAMLESIQDMRWQNEYNLAPDNEAKMKMLVGKLFDLNLRLNETAANKTEDEYDENELKLLREIINYGGKIDALRKEMDDEAGKQEKTRNYSDNYGSFYAQALSYSHANNHQEKIAENTKKTAQNTKETKDAVDNLSANLTWG